MKWLVELMTSEKAQTISNDKTVFGAYISALLADAFNLFMAIPDEFLSKLLTIVTIVGLIILAALNALNFKLRLREASKKDA